MITDLCDGVVAQAWGQLEMQPPPAGVGLTPAHITLLNTHSRHSWWLSFDADMTAMRPQALAGPPWAIGVVIDPGQSRCS